ncbi:MAG TPA: SgcJ/EcaC family oxidoreductase [Vicinamibacterales bacterium]
MKRDMRIAAVPVALLSIIVGIVGIVSPDRGMTLRRLYFASPGLFYAVVAVRFASGLGLILFAASSRWPFTLRVIGVVVCLQGLAATLLGFDHAHAIMEWEGMQGPTLLRAGAAVSLLTGAFIVFAVTRGASERKVATRGSAKSTTLTNLCMTACAAVACTSCIGPTSTSSQVQTWDSADRQAIGAVVAGYASTWNSRDMKAMHDLDTEDVEWINVAANSWKGRTAVQTGHDTILRTIFSKTMVTVLSTEIRPLAPGVAVAVATMRFAPLVDASGHELAEIKTRGSFTMVKHDGAWKIAHFQNTTIDPVAAQNDPITWEGGQKLPPQFRKK